MKQLAYIRDLLLLLFVVYYAQGAFYETGSIISQVALALVLGISVCYLGKTLLLKNNKNTFYKAWTALLVLNVVGFIFTATYSEPLHVGMIKKILMTALPFYPFYHFSEQGILKSKHLLQIFALMLPITILLFYANASEILSERVSNNTDLTNNVAYSFVALLPYVFLFRRKKILAIGSMLILIFFIIQGSKRGAMVTGGVGLLCFIYYQLRTVPKENRIKGYLLVIIAVLGMAYYAFDVYESNTYLITRLQNTGGEARNIIYANLLNAWASSESFFKLIFGFGFAASLKYSGTGNYAHNDWLELLSNFGLIGIIVYGVLFYLAVKYIRKLNWSIEKKLLMTTVVLIWFCQTLFSMFYTSGDGYVQTILIAYLVGSKSKNLD